MNYNIPQYQYHVTMCDVEINKQRSTEKTTLPKLSIFKIHYINMSDRYGEINGPVVGMKSLKQWNQHQKKNHLELWKTPKYKYIGPAKAEGDPLYIKNPFSMGWDCSVEEFNRYSDSFIPIEPQIIESLIAPRNCRKALKRNISVVWDHIQDQFGIDILEDWDTEKELYRKSQLGI